MDIKTFLEHFNTIAEAPGGIPKLRALILDMAVRGKLVPQDLEDEPASSAIQKGYKEKKEAIRSGKIKPSDLAEALCINALSDELPSGWSWATLLEIIAAKKNSVKRGPFGSSIKKSCFVEKGYKVYEQKNAIYKDFSLGEYYIDQAKFEELKDFEVEPNDIIISCSGTVGELAVAPKDMQKGIINQALLKLSLNESIIINEFFIILFRAYLMKTEILTDLQGTAQKNITSVKILKSLPFPLPPLAEQKRIVEKVDELMGLCDRYEADKQARDNRQQKLRESAIAGLMNAETDKDLDAGWAIMRDNWHTLSQDSKDVDHLRKAILKLAIRGKLAPQSSQDESASLLLATHRAGKAQLIKEGKIEKSKRVFNLNADNIPFNIPKNWEWIQLGEVGNAIKYSIVDGPFGTSIDTRSDYIDAGVPVIRMVNIKPFRFIDKRLKFVSQIKYETLNRHNIIPGDVLLSKVGAGIGESCIFPDSIAYALLSTTGLCRFRVGEITTPEYLCYFLHSISDYLKNIASQNAQPFLNMKTICNTLFPLPPLAEQKRIVAKVDELMKLCDQLEESLRLSRQRAESFASSAISHLTI